MQSVHKSVLLKEIVDSFQIPSNHTPWYLDGTLGGSGHALAIAEKCKGRVNIVGLDQDPIAIERAREVLKGKSEKLILEVGNFSSLDIILQAHRIEHLDFVFFDLGLSSDELEHSGKGFSFLKEEPLLMTMGNPDQYPFTAAKIVNEWDEAVVADVIFGYGEEKYARRIAKAIVTYRTKAKIETSTELAEIVRSAVPPFYRRGKIHPATKTFQALRIAVNDELKALTSGIEKGYEKLVLSGRLAIISFHSLEDRIVKNSFKKFATTGGRILTKKPVTPSDEEIVGNPRSRSAKLRIIEK